MNDVIVVAGATHRDWLLDEYEKQLKSADIPFILEAVEPMPAGPDSMTILRKLRFVRQTAERYAHFKTIYITDAWDVLFYGTRQELIDKAMAFQFAAERNSYPESVQGQGPTAWKYCNAGCMVGNPASLQIWADLVERHADLDILDQAWLNRHLNDGIVPLDTTTNLFYVVSGWLEDGALQVKNGRPWNSRCNTYPNFFHFSGRCPVDNFRKILEG